LAQLRGYIDGINQEIIELLSQIPDPAHNETILLHPISTRESDFVDQKVWDTAISPWK
jgi:hypothetical protein